MSASPKARDSLFNKESKTPATTSKLPPQIEERLKQGGGKLASDADVAKIKDAIQNICAKERADILKSPDADEKDPETQQKLKQKKYRYYGKTELASAMGVDKNAIPYGVDFFEAKIQDQTREIYCFKLPGLQGQDPDEIQTIEDFVELEKKIIGLGGSGKVLPLSNMDDPAEAFAVKIKNFQPDNDRQAALADWYADREFQHAFAAELALARCLRDSPSHHNEMQERIYMRYVPGLKTIDFFEIYGNALSMLERALIYRDMALAIKNGSHRFGAVHRDLKSENFHIDPETFACKLLDFGFQGTLENGVLWGNVQGTPHYIAPEILADCAKHPREQRVPYTFQSDLYAFGVILAASLHQISERYTGAGGIHAVLKDQGIKIIDTETESFKKFFPDVQARDFLFRFIKSLVQKNPKERPASIDDCIVIFDRLAGYLRALELSGDASEHARALSHQIYELEKRVPIEVCPCFIL